MLLKALVFVVIERNDRRAWKSIRIFSRQRINGEECWLCIVFAVVIETLLYLIEIERTQRILTKPQGDTTENAF